MESSKLAVVSIDFAFRKKVVIAIWVFTIFSLISCDNAGKTDTNNSENNLKINNQSDNSQKVTKVQLNNFEEQLTVDGIFWQSEFGNLTDFLFKKDGTCICLTNGNSSSKLTGKWFFNKSNGVLQIAWQGDKQYAPYIDKIEPDWSTIYLSTKIHEYGSEVLKKMKLLDNRFQQ